MNINDNTIDAGSVKFWFAFSDNEYSSIKDKTCQLAKKPNQVMNTAIQNSLVLNAQSNSRSIDEASARWGDAFVTMPTLDQGKALMDTMIIPSMPGPKNIKISPGEARILAVTHAMNTVPKLDPEVAMLMHNQRIIDQRKLAIANKYATGKDTPGEEPVINPQTALAKVDAIPPYRLPSREQRKTFDRYISDVQQAEHDFLQKLAPYIDTTQEDLYGKLFSDEAPEHTMRKMLGDERIQGVLKTIRQNHEDETIFLDTVKNTPLELVKIVGERVKERDRGYVADVLVPAAWDLGMPTWDQYCQGWKDGVGSGLAQTAGAGGALILSGLEITSGVTLCSQLVKGPTKAGLKVAAEETVKEGAKKAAEALAKTEAELVAKKVTTQTAKKTVASVTSSTVAKAMVEQTAKKGGSQIVQQAVQTAGKKVAGHAAEQAAETTGKKVMSKTVVQAAEQAAETTGKQVAGQTAEQVAKTAVKKPVSQLTRKEAATELGKEAAQLFVSDAVVRVPMTIANSMYDKNKQKQNGKEDTASQKTVLDDSSIKVDDQQVTGVEYKSQTFMEKFPMVKSFSDSVSNFAKPVLNFIAQHPISVAGAAGIIYGLYRTYDLWTKYFNKNENTLKQTNYCLAACKFTSNGVPYRLAYELTDCDWHMMSNGNEISKKEKHEFMNTDYYRQFMEFCKKHMAQLEKTMSLNQSIASLTSSSRSAAFLDKLDKNWNEIKQEMSTGL